MMEPDRDRQREEIEAAIPEVQEALGQSEAFLAFQEHLSRAARVDRPVLILGERGTGKELAATRLHFLSKRWQQPFVALNCAALTPSLIESELFGHEAGAFTGATGRRAGRFEMANQGTLFLDEIGLIPLETQEKILRAVEYGVFERVGSSRPVRVDVRIIGATNADLRTLASAGRFRQDLLDRLSFEVLHLPPLRVRQEDTLLLANHFAARMAHELGWEEVPEFSDEALLALESYAWPGNVRELENAVKHAIAFLEGDEITSEVLPRRIVNQAEPPQGEEATNEFEQYRYQSLKAFLRTKEREYLEQVLSGVNGDKEQAAKALQISLATLYRKLPGSDDAAPASNHAQA